MTNLLVTIQKNMTLAIPLTLAAGFAIGFTPLTEYLAPAILPLTFLMVYPTMLVLNFRKVFSKEDMRLQGFAQLFNFLLMPALAYVLGLIFFPDQVALRLGLFMTGLLPTSGMTLSWTQAAKGNMPAAVKMTLLGLILGSLLAPFYIQAIFARSIDLPLGKLLTQVGLVIFAPMALAFLTQLHVSEPVRKRMAPWSSIGVLGVLFAATALKARDLAAHPGLLLSLGIPVLVFYIINFTLSTLLARGFSRREDGIAFVYGTSLRNLSIALAIALSVLGKDGSEVALLISVAFLLQSQLAAWHSRHLGRLLPIRASATSRSIPK